MTELFDRRCTLQISTKTSSRQWTSGQKNELDLTFSAEKTAGSEPNRCDISVWNLSEDSRRLVSDEGATVRLSAGYVGTEALVFVGDVDDVQTSRDGADVLSRISCSDGGLAIRSTVVNISTKKDTPVSDLVDQLVGQLGLPKGPIAVVSGALKRGLAVLGPVQKALDELCSSNGLRWSVQDGAVQVHPVTGTPDAVVVLSQDTGLVGIPERLVQRDQKGGVERRGVKCRSLLQPGLNPGRRIRVKSEWVSGDFVVERVGHSGSTVGGEWYTDVEAY